VAVRDIDLGWGSIKRDLASMQNSFTKVGLPHEGKVGAPAKKGSGRKISNSKPKLIQVALYNEFGTKYIPARPAFKQAFDQNIGSITSVIEQTYNKVLSLRVSPRRGLGLIGEFMTSKIKRQITKLKTPPNSWLTKRIKKSRNPLIDTGQLRNSITHHEVMR